MENIKRYSGTISTSEFTNSFVATHRENKEGNWVKYSDHKAVVETKDNKILELKTDLMFKEESVKLQNKSMEAMQNKIEELEKENKKLFLELEDRRNDLLETKGLVKICKGAGQCDHDGSTCNKYDNCGEYDPVIRGIAKGIK